MRILTIVHDLGPGGTQRVAQNYSIGYRSAGHDVAVLAHSGGGVRVEAVEAAGIPVFAGGEQKEALACSVEQAVAWDAEVVHVHRVGLADKRTGDILRRLREAAPSWLPVVETNIFGKPDFSPDRLLIDVHLQLTRWSFWKWRQWTSGMRPAPCGVLCPNAVETQRFFPPEPAVVRDFRAAHGIPQDAFVFGRIGQPIVWKWSPLIFDAFASVARRYANTHLLLVGLPNALRSHLDALDPALRARITEIDFLHGDDSLRQAYGAMDVFLHAAVIGESFGLVLTEAMCCGCPVVTLSTPTKDNGQVEVVGHNEGGLVVTDVDGMVSAMCRLIEDEPLRRRLAAGGAPRVVAQYDLRPVLSVLLRIVDACGRADSTEALHRQLRDDAELVTHVDDAEIKALLKNVSGRVSLRQLVLMRIVHQPHFYRLWSTLKNR